MSYPFSFQITTYYILHTKYEYVRYYTKLNPKNQGFSEKKSITRRPLSVVRMLYIVCLRLSSIVISESVLVVNMFLVMNT